MSSLHLCTDATDVEDTPIVEARYGTLPGSTLLYTVIL